ncbi:MAG: hypothetical protein AB7K63_07380, partial [Vicinamibacterales bacterium]
AVESIDDEAFQPVEAAVHANETIVQFVIQHAGPLEQRVCQRVFGPISTITGEGTLFPLSRRWHRR